MPTPSPPPLLHPTELAKRFTILDYVVFGSMLFFSAIVGIAFAMSGVHKSYKEYVMGGRQLHCLPVALSLTASFMSAVTVLGTPAETYRYGTGFGLFAITYFFVVLISAELFVPVFYRLGISSTYEYLELRYNKYLRLLGTLMFMTLTILYTGIVMYSPALALNQVTGFQLWGSLVATGIVCVFYCTLGGLKAVVWTDVFQYILMISGFLCIIIRTMVIKGGIGPIMEDARQGGRLIPVNFSPNPLQRHTFWTVVVGGTFTWLGIYGVNQAQVQRYLACRSQFHAKCALYINLIGLWITISTAMLSGLSMYSIYKNCDPWSAGFVKAPDQLVPYLVLEILGEFPGVSGLFVAGTYSGTLSTVSSSISALAAVTVEDLVKPYFQLSENTLARASMGMTLLFGAVCIAMAAVASSLGSVLQASLTIFGILGGPLLGVFSLGILLPFANTKGAFSGILCGFLLTLWVGIGSSKYPPSPHRTSPLKLSAENCPRLNASVIAQLTTLSPPSNSPRPFLQEYWYSLSYLYFSATGTLTTFIVGTIVSIVTGGLKQEVNLNLLFTKEDFFTNFVEWKKHCVTKGEKVHPSLQEVSPEENT